MPITKKAKKALRQSKRRAEYNLQIKEDLKTLIKKIKKAVDNKESQEKLIEMLKQAQKSIDKAVQKGIIRKNTGSRKLSRLMGYHKRGGQVKPVKENEKKETPLSEQPEE